ncbi:MAG: hypothetical protein GY714_19630 [Desulfobacterales bacterium]|nr:hypothetical protein [Desulfobacterales bacterium]
MLKKIVLLVIVFIAFGCSKFEPGPSRIIEKTHVFGKFIENPKSKICYKITIRDVLTEFEIRVPVKNNFFSAKLPSEYRIASIKFNECDSRLNFSDTRNLRNCKFKVLDNNRVYCLGDIYTNLKAGNYKEVRKNKTINAIQFYFTH